MSSEEKPPGLQQGTPELDAARIRRLVREELDAKRPSKLERAESVAKVASLVLIPIVIPIALAIYSARIQASFQKETIDRDYVQIAVSILREDKPDNKGLRDWAVDLLNEHSPTKFKQTVIDELKSGKASLPVTLLSVSPGVRPPVRESANTKAFRLSEEIHKFVWGKS